MGVDGLDVRCGAVVVKGSDIKSKTGIFYLTCINHNSSFVLI